jgi:hypothetical protein
MSLLSKLQLFVQAFSAGIERIVLQETLRDYETCIVPMARFGHLATIQYSWIQEQYPFT